jgi:site-specific DNA-methyltransferase (adenine-specific)
MIKLIHGKFEDIPQSEIGNIDLIIADIPDCLNQKYPDYIDKMPKNEYEAKLHLWLEKMSKLTKGPIFFLCNERWIKEVENTISNIGIKLIQRLLWHYNFGMDQSRHNKYSLCYRPIYWLHSDFIIPENIKIPSDRQIKYNDSRAAPTGKIPQNVWSFPRICGSFRERRPWFPNQINQKVIERIILGHCPINGTIYDPFIGSGTSVFAAISTNRNVIGSDISKTCIRQIRKSLNL